MSVNNKVLAVVLAGLCGIVSAQTIDELSDLNRQAMIADAKAKLDKKKDVPPAAPGAPGMPGAPGGPMGAAMPPGMPMPAAPSVPNRAAAGNKKLEKQEKPVAVPVLIAIYGVGGRLVTELADSGFEAKYREGDRTPSGWTVSRIEKRLVAMTRPQAKGGIQTVSLPFGIKLDEPKEKEKEKDAVLTQAGGLSMPPLPPNFQMLAK